MSPTEILILENQRAIMGVLRDMNGGRDGPQRLSDQIRRTEYQLKQHVYKPLVEHVDMLTSNDDLREK